MIHPTVQALTEKYFTTLGLPSREIESFYFCDNEKDANECAELVLNDDKRATAASLWWYEANGLALPKIGDIYIVTNWDSIAQCVIEVEKVEITAFNKITPEFAATEGEGDKSLEYWKKVHWDYYHRELADAKYKPTEDMPIVCEYFKVVFCG